MRIPGEGTYEVWPGPERALSEPHVGQPSPSQPVLPDTRDTAAR